VFGSAVDVYERTRPGYPAAALRWVLGEVPLRVLDLGAGTGKLTRELVALGHSMIAVEPDEAMRDRLSTVVPGATVVAGAAEAIPLPDGAVDAVVAGQAYHWFDRSRAVPEMARVLAPSGRLGLVWNLRDDTVPWVRALSGLIGSEDSTSYLHLDAEARVGPPFAPLQRRKVAHVQKLSPAAILDLLRSRSYVIALPADEREVLLERVADLLRTHPQTAGAALLQLPYLTYAYRSRLPG